jgi:hypothetical protein
MTTTRKNLPGLGSIFLRGRTWYVESSIGAATSSTANPPTPTRRRRP